MKSILILEREDLPFNKSQDIRNIQYHDFRHEHMDMIRKHDIVIFMDDDFSVRVIKSRYPMQNQNEIF